MLKFIATPGHGYLRVTHKKAIKAGIVDKISSFSGMNSQYIFLEEDIDAALICSGKSFVEGVDYKCEYQDSCVSHNYNKNWINNPPKVGMWIEREFKGKIERYVLTNKIRRSWLMKKNNQGLRYKIATSRIIGNEFYPVPNKMVCVKWEYCGVKYFEKLTPLSMTEQNIANLKLAYEWWRTKSNIGVYDDNDNLLISL